MAIPPFGFLKIEALACFLMLAAGMVGLVVTVTGWTDWLAVFPWSRAVWPHVHIYWLVLQSLAVVAGGIAAWRSNSFVLAAVGVASSLVKSTPVGCISYVPGLLMLLLLLARFRAFGMFLSRWKGPSPPPPGAWR